MQFTAVSHHFLRRDNRRGLIGASILLGVFFMLITPKVPHSTTHHLFADMRNFLGVPNTMNVLTCFPFLLVGVPSLVLCLSGACFGMSFKGEIWGWALFYAGIAAAAFGSAYYHLKPDDDRVIWEKLPFMTPFLSVLGVPNTMNVLTCFPFLLVGVPSLVLCLSGACFGMSFKGEIWGWALFYAGIAAAAFGSAYYHLKPDDDRVIWEKLPVMIAIVSLISNLVIERVDERTGLTCLFSLLALVFVSVACERTFNDLRLCMMFDFVPCIVIPALVLLFPPKYTHSKFWYCATGFYLLSRIEAIADKRVYGVNRYIISGHSLEHLCFAMVPLILSIMLWSRNIKLSRDY